ncbi:hypothetical protein AMR41_00055 [Hapalosiphon sp. MRB220]|nr:hypothetical protein AMR41_00055 [Hapalosiphon sp. MRB220]
MINKNGVQTKPKHSRIAGAIAPCCFYIKDTKKSDYFSFKKIIATTASLPNLTKHRHNKHYRLAMTIATIIAITIAKMKS